MGIRRGFIMRVVVVVAAVVAAAAILAVAPRCGPDDAALVLGSLLLAGCPNAISPAGSTAGP
jgi:predicted small secreted protein